MAKKKKKRKIKKTKKLLDNIKENRTSKYACLAGKKPEYKDDYPKKAVDFVVERKEKNKVPTIAGLANYLGHDEATMYRWRDKYLQFGKAISYLQQIQKELIINNGLTKDFSSSMSKFMLNVNHKMVETTHNVNTNQNVDYVIPLPDENNGSKG
jgi:transposase-like protein